MDKYQNDQIGWLHFPPYYQDADGTWSRRWKVTLKHKIGSEAHLDKVSRSAERPPHFILRIVPAGERELILVTQSSECPISPIYLEPLFRAFQLLDGASGNIDTIEGSPKEDWPPFRLL